MLSLGMKNRQALWKIVWKFLKQLPHNPAVRIKCNSVRGKKALCQKKKKSMQKLGNQCFYQHYSIAKRQNPKRQLNEEWTNKCGKYIQ